MGEVHYDLTLPEALEAYEKIPSERMHGLKCVGFDLKDGSDYEGMQSLMIEGKIQKEFLNSIPGFRENLCAKCNQSCGKVLGRKTSKC